MTPFLRLTLSPGPPFAPGLPGNPYRQNSHDYIFGKVCILAGTCMVVKIQ